MTAPLPVSARLEEAGQFRMLRHLASLSHEDAATLGKDLESVDFELLARARKLALQAPASPASIEPPAVVCGGRATPEGREAVALGELALRQGQVAALVVAGGQGTRLGHPGPKGTFPASPLTQKPLFRIFAEKLLAASRRYGVTIPWFVMTSPENRADTAAFFDKNRNFGLPKGCVRFFEQGTMPATDDGGELLLESPTRLFRSPDGHGGTLLALRKSGSLDVMRNFGIHQVFYFQVDNPLVVMVDPLFIGHHLRLQSEFSGKFVRKRGPDEKVGVFVQRAGRTEVIEYSDLPAHLREAKVQEGRLRFDAGSIAVHVLDVGFVSRLTEGAFALPFHLARKEIPAFQDGAVRPVAGIKYESFIFDALPLATRTCVLEADREDEFSPIKNKDGEDSPATSARDQSALFVRWLKAAGVPVHGKGSDPSGPRVEISPLWADSADEVRDKAKAAGIVVDGSVLG